MKLKNYSGNAVLRSIILPVLSLFMANVVAAPLPAPILDTDYYYDGAPPANKVLLGKNLFWDKLLSGANDVSCGTCHNPQFGTGDSLSLPIGAGGDGGGMLRVANTALNRIVRNALSLYNNGAKEFTAFGNDGDVRLGPNGEYLTPVGTLPDKTLVTNIDNVLAAQALFPLTAAREQTGIDPNNPISVCAIGTAAGAAKDFTCVWTGLVQKIQAIPAYVDLFKLVYPKITSASGIKINHVVNAIAAYQIVNFRSDDAPFDKYLRGDTSAMSDKAIAGMNLFYGSAGCSSCHSGVFQTDHDYHAIAAPQIGPGRRDGVNGKDDGLFRNTQDPADRHKYKTPSLRNVAYTGPWTHAGAYSTLEGVILHHLDPVTSLNNYDTTQAILPPFPNTPSVATIDFQEHNNLTARAGLAESNELAPMSLTDDQVDELIAFMYALTGDSALNFKDKIPLTVLSGLPVAD